MPALWVANSSPLIVFERLGQTNLLQAVIERLYIPPAVRREVFGADFIPQWIEEHPLTQPVPRRVATARVDAGEREAIALALELGATWLLIDDLRGRRLAQAVGLNIVGSAGYLLRAKDKGLIPAVRPLLEAMRGVRSRISDRVFAKILAAAGES